MPNTSPEYIALRNFFESVTTYPATISLDGGTTIPDVKLFVENNLKALRSGEMNEVAMAGRYYRMRTLIGLLKK